MEVTKRKLFGINLLLIGFALLYGVFCFFVFTSDNLVNSNFTDTFSITFLAMVPLTMGVIISILFYPAVKFSVSNEIFFTLTAIICFLLISLIYESNNAIFALAISVPYILFSLLGVYLGRLIIKQTFYRRWFIPLVLLLPFLFSLVENIFSDRTTLFWVKNIEVIDAQPTTIWKNIIRVNPIRNDEYPFSFINWLGIPKPLYAELDRDTIDANRIGHFEGGLEFKEKVIAWERNKYIELSIQIEPSKLSPNIFNHQVLNGRHFKFVKAYYKIEPKENGTCQLSLFSSYQISSHISWYAGLWGNFLLRDFQRRLLLVIKMRCQK